MKIEKIAVRDIEADVDQPRKMFDPALLRQLKESIKKEGLRQPIEIEKIEGGKYRLVDGERRLRSIKELGFKEVDAIVSHFDSDLDRLVKQFHIQAQHEDWTSTEKAVAIYKIGQLTGESVSEVAKRVGLPARTVNRYMAFANLVDKDAFQRNNIQSEWYRPVANLKAQAHKIYNDEFEKEFTTNDEREVENAIVSRILSGSLKRPANMTKLKDTFKKSPKLLKEFLSDPQVSAESLFIRSKAKGAYFLRNALTTLHSGEVNLRQFLNIKDIALLPADIATLKSVKKAINETLDLAGADIG